MTKRGYDGNDMVEIDCEVRVPESKNGACAIWLGKYEIKDGKQREKWHWIPLQYCDPAEDGTSLLVKRWFAEKEGLV